MTGVSSDIIKAAKEGDEVGFKALLDYPDCEPLLKDGNSLSALMWAATRGHYACMQLLLPVSLPLATDDRGHTALMWAATHGHPDCIQLLLPVSNALVRSKTRMTASDYARSQRHHQSAELIDGYALAVKEGGILKGATRQGVPNTRPSRHV